MGSSGTFFVGGLSVQDIFRIYTVRIAELKDYYDIRDPASFDDDRGFMPHMYIEYTLKKGKIMEGDSYTGLNYDDDDSWVCSKNGEACSYSNFNRFVESMDETVEFVDNTAANRHAQGLE